VVQVQQCEKIDPFLFYVAHLEKRYWNQGNPVKLLTDSSKKVEFDDTQKQDSIRYSRMDVVQSADNLTFLALTPYKFNGGEI
jgi:hypothetical protein